MVLPPCERRLKNDILLETEVKKRKLRMEYSVYFGLSLTEFTLLGLTSYQLLKYRSVYYDNDYGTATCPQI